MTMTTGLIRSTYEGTTQVSTPPTPTQPIADGETVHAYCCRPDIALCGEDLTGRPYFEIPPSCRACQIASRTGRRCGALLCRTRRWLRWMWSR